jgi:hypothetical protein
MHKPARKNFPRRRVKVLFPGDLLQADLVDMQKYSKDNKGYKYLLTVIDCFSKKGWAAPVKDKSGPLVTKAMESILPDNVKNLQTDQGLEFFNKHFSALMKARNINHYHTYSHMKASIVERWNRSLKGWMWREFSIQGNYKWLDMLPKLVDKYNNKIHRSIGMKPNQVNLQNKDIVYDRLMNKRVINSKPKYKVGDTVRISKYKHIFSKGYNPTWTGELFTIDQVQDTKPVTYILKDENGEIIKGGFYEQEIQKTKHKDVYLVEKVIKRKGDKLFVKWLGYPPTHNSWLDVKDVVK